MTIKSQFQPVRRQQFRDYFQPSRIMIACVSNSQLTKLNFITLCFAMHAAYKPSSIAFAVEKRHFSHSMLKPGYKCVLAIPGVDLTEETLYCGTNSGRDVDKLAELKLDLLDMGSTTPPGLAMAIGNIELSITGQMDSGDHDVFLGRVEQYLINEHMRKPGLLSIGADETGYKVIARKGIHRIAVPKGSE